MSRTRRVALVLVTIGLLLLGIVSGSSAASLKVASACITLHHSQQTSSIYQRPTRLQIAKTEQFCKLARLSVNKLRYWDKDENRWRLYPRHKNQKCWEIIDLRESVPTCMMARKQVRQHTERFVQLTDKIHELTRPKLAGWLLDSFTCVHGGEGAWNANTGNGYYGGLQMDISFQQAYGPEFYARWGTADNWPIWAQLFTAVRGYLSRGFAPWPNTARACGLL